jgi:hypothetical protein
VARPDLRRALTSAGGLHGGFGARAASRVPAGAVMVVHSAAGALTPFIAAAAAGRLAAVIFVDAVLPTPGMSWFDTAPPDLANRVRAGATDGQTPQWPDWFPDIILEELLPDPMMRTSLRDTAPTMPLEWLEAPAPVLDLSPLLPCAYLQLSGAYCDEAERAAAEHWPVARLEGRHLSMMTEPDLTSAAIADLADRLVAVQPPMGRE